MLYRDLNALLDGSSSSREYFLSLPAELQMDLHRHPTLISSAQDLRHFAGIFSRLRYGRQFPHDGPFPAP